MIRQFEPSFNEDDAQAVADTIRSGYINEHKFTKEFERKFAEFTGVKYAVATTSGTASLFLALRALGIGYGDKVIVPDYTAIGTANAVRLAGATPILIEIDEYNGNIDTSQIEIKGVKAIIPVHINGRVCNMDVLAEIALQHDLALVEDASQTLGSRDNGKHLGTFGEVGCFSMATTKIITTGQGGVVITNKPEINQRLRELKDQGRASDRTSVKELQDHYPGEGYNFKFSETQAALGLSQFRRLSERIEHKKNISSLYREFLGTTFSFLEGRDGELLWYTDAMTQRVGQNAAIKEELLNKEIEIRLFPKPLHMQSKYQYSGTDFLCALNFSAKGFWLPSSSFLTDEDIGHICDEIKMLKSV